MSQILPHFFVSNPRTRQEYYKLVKAEILKLAPNICYFIQLLRLDIAIVKSYYRLSSDLYRKYVLSLLWHLHGSSSSWPTSGRSMPEVVLLDFGNCPLFIYRRPTLIWTNLSKSNLLVISLDIKFWKYVVSIRFDKILNTYSFIRFGVICISVFSRCWEF